MDSIITYLPLITAIVMFIVGYTKLGAQTSQTASTLERVEIRLEATESKLSVNDKNDAVLRQQVKELMEYKSESSQSKDLAMQKLSSIESFVKSIDKRLDKMEQKVNA